VWRVVRGIYYKDTIAKNSWRRSEALRIGTFDRIRLFGLKAFAGEA
jgi:hypothetical protein